MSLPHNLPNLLVDEGARRLALAHLNDAMLARERMTSASDSEALHDYRVALRRLRSCLRAYRNALRSSITRPARRRLRRLARSTNRSRDLEVHLAWLIEQRDTAAQPERPGIAWMAERLAGEKQRAWGEMIELDAALFPGIHRRLTSRLSRFRATIDLDFDSHRRSTAAVTARRVRRASRQLERRLGTIQGYGDSGHIHLARISAKRLRYLLEPFVEVLTGSAPLVDRLKTLQDSLGDVHDAQVFEVELRAALPAPWRPSPVDPGLVPGLHALLAALETRGRGAFGRASADWLHGAANPFFQAVADLADALAALVDRDREVERKFLLTGLPPLEGAEAPVDIEQGYLPGERLIERLRRTRSANGVELVRTVKEGTGLSRLEVEEPVAPEVFDRLWPLTEGRRVHKRRYRVAEGDLTWEIDQFLDRDLVLAEVELAGGCVNVELPPWLRSHVDREVTDDEAFSNYRLAVGT